MRGNIWFTSDFHLGHANIIRYCSRPFDSVDEMDAAILERLNEAVKQDDELYFLGDLCFGRPDRVEAYLSRIRCRNIYFVCGNHDAKVLRFAHLFRWCKDLAEVNIDGHRVVLCHYPMRAWNKSHYGSWHLHGHTHGRLPEDPHALSLDVGVDTHEYWPWLWEEIAGRLSCKEQDLRAQGRFQARHQTAAF